MSVIEAVTPVVAPERRRLMGSAYDLSGATSAAEARVLAGLEWDAIHRPLYVDLPNDQGLALSPSRGWLPERIRGSVDSPSVLPDSVL